MKIKKITPMIQNLLSLPNASFQVLKKEEKQMLLYDEVNGIYFDIKQTDQVGDIAASGLLGFSIDLTYEKSKGLGRHIEMLDKGKVVLDEVSFTEGDYTVTFKASEQMDIFEFGEEEDLLKLVSSGDSAVTRIDSYYLAVNPNRDYFDISLKQGKDVIYTEHCAKNYEKDFECNTVRIEYRKKDGTICSGFYHVNTTIATESNCKFYRMTYTRENETEPNYTSYFLSSVYDNLEVFKDWAPYQFSDFEDPYSILLKNTDIKKEEVISYLSAMNWGLDDIRLTVVKLKNQFVIVIRNASGIHSSNLPTIHSNPIDKKEIEVLKEYLETVIQDELFLRTLNQELDKFSSHLEQESEKNVDVVDTFSTESLFHQGMEETKDMICSNNTSVIEQLLKKKNSFELNNIKEKIKEYQ
ncbi:MAG: hypothetical protein K2I72_03650 [Bacilli bacterium]|nr:hypothetical protein [Bacilli bacterium]